MADITSMMQDFQNSMVDLQTTHLHIKDKAAVSRKLVHDQMIHFEEMENRASRVERVFKKNGANLKSVLEMTHDLLRKADSLSVTVQRSLSSPPCCASSTILPENGSSPPNLDKNNERKSNITDKQSLSLQSSKEIISNSSNKRTRSHDLEGRSDITDKKSLSSQSLSDVSSHSTDKKTRPHGLEENNRRSNITDKHSLPPQSSKDISSNSSDKRTRPHGLEENNRSDDTFKQNIISLTSNDSSANKSDNNTRPLDNNQRSKASCGTMFDSDQIVPLNNGVNGSHKTSVNSMIGSNTNRTKIFSEMQRPNEKKETDDNTLKSPTLKPATTVVTKSESKTVKLDSGLKSCLTRVDQDNRTSFQTGSKCYQGKLLSSNEGRHVKRTAENVKPNIVPVKKTQERIPVPSEQSNKRTAIDALVRRDFQQSQGVHSLHEWYQIATGAELRVALNLGINASKISNQGHMYVLLLDVSESMRGQKFDLMIKTAKEYIKGHQEIRARYGINDNIGLACFGETTDLLLPPMTDYEGLIAELDTLKPGGPSPMAAGIIMALSAITRGLGITRINKHRFKPHVIMVTDGIPTRLEALNEEDSSEDNSALAASQFLTNFQRDKELNHVVVDFAKRGFTINCVPCGSTNIDILTSIASTTFGRVVQCDQIHRLSRMTMTMFDASEIAQRLQYSTDINSEIVRNTLESNKVHDPYGDINNLVIGLLDPRRLHPGYFKKPKWRRTPLGTRVRRGPHWRYKNEDNGDAGTVIGGGVNDESLLWVEWDNGHRNGYAYEENMKIFEVKPVNERRVLADAMIGVGCKVKRGKDWKHGDQDGGIGSVGTVLRVEENGRVFVNWDRDKLAIYIFAVDDVFEVEVCNDPGQTLTSSFLIEDQAIRNLQTQHISDSPHILTGQTSKPVKQMTVTWQYQNENRGWTSYGEDANIKIEKAFIRNRTGNCIVEHSGNVYVLRFARMIQENQTSKSTSTIRRIDKKPTEEQELIYED